MDPTSLVVLCHPDPRSYCHAIARKVTEALTDRGRTVHVQDLYSQNFDPVLSLDEERQKTSLDALIQGYAREAEQSQQIIWIFPEWWGLPPARLKGWLDRVLRPGVAFDYQGDFEDTRRRIQRFAGKTGTVFMTSDQSPPPPIDQTGADAQGRLTRVLHRRANLVDRLRDQSGHHPLARIWQESVGNFTGLTMAGFYILGPVRNSEYTTRISWLSQIGEILQHPGGS
ncbi:NAD(P)H-dependent oxidoreductase [Spirochaeta lutea]|uniref:NAD(P)H-dependent oxidoreductase n=1 Tax=Spirochaeta lutea TaxID=1480694 RepID=UPI0006902626|nr:NAD(P)H-dependent oxidoreductase [Spirochaeta lutea]